MTDKLKLRSGTPLTDAIKEALKDPKFAEDFAAGANAFAAGMRVVTAAEETRESGPLTFEDFLKIDLRMGTVTAADRVPKSDKLLKMQVRFGSFERQVLAGVGKTFEPEALVGKQYLFVVNLPPRKMMGLESHGMLLATGAPDSLALVSPASPVPDGSRLG